MKPKTKKTLIVVLTVAVVAIVVWLVFFRKKEWEKLLEKIDIDKTTKDKIRNEVKRMLKDPGFKKDSMEKQAQEYNVTYDQWLIMTAAMNIGYTPSIDNIGTIRITVMGPQPSEL